MKRSVAGMGVDGAVDDDGSDGHDDGKVPGGGGDGLSVEFLEK